MAGLTGVTPSNSYKDLLYLNNGNAGLTAALETIYDGAGTASTLQLSTTTANFNGTLSATTSLVAPLLNSAGTNLLLTATGNGGAQSQGTATNDAASTGYVGELLTATVASGSAVSLTTATGANVTSLSLTPGDWDVWGDVYYSGGGSTTVTYIAGAVSPTTGTLSTTNGAFAYAYLAAGTPFTSIAAGLTVKAGPLRVSLAATTTYFLVAQASFGTSTCSAYGVIFARRRR